MVSTPPGAVDLRNPLIELLEKQEALRVAGLSFQPHLRVTYDTSVFA